MFVLKFMMRYKAYIAYKQNIKKYHYQPINLEYGVAKLFLCCVSADLPGKYMEISRQMLCRHLGFVPRAQTCTHT